MRRLFLLVFLISTIASVLVVGVGWGWQPNPLVSEAGARNEEEPGWLSLILHNSPLTRTSEVNGGWWVASQLQNIATQTASIEIRAVPVDSSSFEEANEIVEIEPHDGYTWLPTDIAGTPPALAEGFIGSAALISDQPVVAIGNISNNKLFGRSLGVEGGMAAAQYRGAGRKDADTRISFPLLKNDFVGQTTAFYIQAAGEPAQVTMMYKTNDGETYTDGPHELVADEMHIFNPAMAGVPRGCEPPSLQAACVGSAVATSSTGEIVGIYTEYPTTVDPATFVMATRGFTTGDTDTRVAVPVIKNQWVGRTTALTVQNAETDARVTVNVAFNGVSGTCADESYSGATISLEPGESTIYFPRLGNMGGLPTNCFGSALVTASGGEIVAVVNEAGAGKKTAYSAFDVSNATRQVALPLVKKLFVGRTTGVVIQNVGNSPTDVVVDLHVVNRVGGDSPGNVTSEPFTIPPGEAKSLWQVLGCFNHFPLPIICEELNGTVSNVMITSTAENIGAIAQESGVGIDVDVKNYEGFNISASDR